MDTLDGNRIGNDDGTGYERQGFQVADTREDYERTGIRDNQFSQGLVVLRRVRPDRSR